MKCEHDARKYKLGNVLYSGFVIIPVRITVKDELFVDIEEAIVGNDAYFLLVLDLLVRMKVILEFEECTMTSKIDGWMALLAKKLGHAYIEWSTHTMYTRYELRWMHRNSYHPNNEKMYAVIKQAETKHAKTDVYSTLDKLCET